MKKHSEIENLIVPAPRSESLSQISSEEAPTFSEVEKFKKFSFVCKPKQPIARISLRPEYFLRSISNQADHVDADYLQ
jgi:hypothetical protein